MEKLVSGTKMPKSLAVSNPTCWRFQVIAIRLIAISVEISTLTMLHIFGNDLVAMSLGICDSNRVISL